MAMGDGDGDWRWRLEMGKSKFDPIGENVILYGSMLISHSLLSSTLRFHAFPCHKPPDQNSEVGLSPQTMENGSQITIHGSHRPSASMSVRNQDIFKH